MAGADNLELNAGSGGDLLATDKGSCQDLGAIGIAWTAIFQPSKHGSGTGLA